MSAPSPILPLLQAVSDGTEPVPESLVRFDGVVGGAEVDDYEWSVRVDHARLERFGATYYFDTGKAGSPSRAEVNARFSTALEGLMSVAPPGLEALLSLELGDDDAILQVVLGVDGRGREEETRFKYYFILRGDPSSTVRSVCDAFEVAIPSSIDPSLCTILGIDLGAQGLVDVKLYFALDRRLLPRVVRMDEGVTRLARLARVVILQHCLRRPRRQLYFHADGPRALESELTRLAASVPGTAKSGRLYRRARSAGFAVEPWILAHPYADHALDEQRHNLYFHFAR